MKKIIKWLNIIRVYRNEDPSNFLLLRKKRIQYNHDNLITYNTPAFMEDSHFRNAYEQGIATARGSGLLRNDYEIFWRVHVLCWAANQVKQLEGDFIEFGVNTGIFSLSIINYVEFEKLNKTFYLLDTFDGLSPKYSSEKELLKSKSQEYNKDGNLLETVKDRFKGKNVKIIPGPVPETLKEIEAEQIAFVSIDMNSAVPEREALLFVWPKLVSGAIVILDDYGYPGHEDQRIIHDEFAKKNGCQILCLPTCQGLIIKK